MRAEINTKRKINANFAFVFVSAARQRILIFADRTKVNQSDGITIVSLFICFVFDAANGGGIVVACSGYDVTCVAFIVAGDETIIVFVLRIVDNDTDAPARFE